MTRSYIVWSIVKVECVRHFKKDYIWNVSKPIVFPCHLQQMPNFHFYICSIVHIVSLYENLFPRYRDNSWWKKNVKKTGWASPNFFDVIFSHQESALHNYEHRSSKIEAKKLKRNYSPLSCILDIIIFNIERFYISLKTIIFVLH